MTAETSSGARDAESTARVRGVDCVRAWATARDAAEELYEALAKLGLGPEDVRLTPHADGEGKGVVRLHGTPEGIRLVAQAVRQACS